MKISLQDIELQANHGVFEEEKQTGNLFRVSVSFCVPESKAVETDCLCDTLNYGEIYNLVKQEMAIPSNLLEHVAGRIRNAIRTAFPEASEIHVSISKKKPPVGGKTAWATIEL